MNHIRWAAWGVVDIEALERMQRRNYIKRARVELAEKGIVLSCGGSTQTPWYSVTLPPASGENIVKQQASGGRDAFKKVCEWLLKELGDHERSEDGGVRSAGVQAQGF